MALISNAGTKRDGYSIRYYCQSGVEKPATAILTKDEANYLDSIIVKLLDNGVRLGIEFTSLGNIINHPNEAK